MIAVRVWRAVLVLALILAVVFTVVAPPERCPPVTAAELRSSTEAIVDWFVRNQHADGSWLYLYDADEDKTAAEYNEVRHAGAVMGLYQAAAAGLPGALGSADRGTEWALERLSERDDWAALAFQGQVNTGATALLIAGLTIRREATGDRRYDEVLHRLGRFVLAQTEPSGAVLASYDLTRRAPVAGEYSKYYTGESYWALARLHRTLPGEAWGAAADRIGAYLATSRDEAEGHWPPIPDHWAAYGVAETVEFPERRRPPLTDDELAYARRQAELFGIQARYLGQIFGPWGRLVRGNYEPRGGWYGVIDEAFTGWWLTTRAEPRMADLRAPIAERAACIAGLALSAQSDAQDAAKAAQPGRVEGAWFVDGETRMDDQQHALAGLLRTIPIIEAGEGSASDDDAPPAWLWAIVLVLALNPARAAFAVPRAGRRAVALAAAGGAIGGLLVCAAAALGGPLLGLLDVSEPSFRIAAGLVALLVGATDVVRRPPAAEPALNGRRAALIPIAVPVVARPALLVLALGAGADLDVLVCAGAMVAGVALLTALVARRPSDRAVRWTARLLAVALVAGGAILALDGLLAV